MIPHLIWQWGSCLLKVNSNAILYKYKYIDICIYYNIYNKKIE